MAPLLVEGPTTTGGGYLASAECVLRDVVRRAKAFSSLGVDPGVALAVRVARLQVHTAQVGCEGVIVRVCMGCLCLCGLFVIMRYCETRA